MRKLLSLLLLGTLCTGAFSQESTILDDWSDTHIKVDDNDFFSAFSFVNFTYNHNLVSETGFTPSGWGFEVSLLHIGFKPWRNARFSLGLLDFSADYSYLNGDYRLDMTKFPCAPYKTENVNNYSRVTRAGMYFPVGYVQKFGRSDWSMALFAAPGLGWTRYRNEYIVKGVKHQEHSWQYKARPEFRFKVEAFIWYKYTGVVVRYLFPQDFKGLGVVSAGLSFRI